MPAKPARLPFVEKRFDSGETILNYAEGPATGDPDTAAGAEKPALVLLHRLTSRWQSWQAYLPALSADWHVFALDLRGHGLSSGGHASYRAADYARDMTEFLKSRVNTPAVLLGHSGGALTSLVIAAHSPALVKGMLLSEPPLFLLHDPVEAEPSSYEWFKMVERARRAEMTVEAIAALLQERFPRVRPATLTATAEAIAHVDIGVPQAALSGELVAGFDLDNLLSRITCPVIFLQSEKELGGSLWDEDALRIRAALPQAQIHKLPGVGHNTTDQVEAVLRYLNELR